MNAAQPAPAGTDEQAEAALRERLRQHAADHYPVQHATARFHLGALLLGRGRAREALDELGAAAELFQPRLPVEFAKTLNLIGAAARELDDQAAARASFEQAAATLDDHDQQLEAAAARHNLGLVLVDQGEPGEAAGQFLAARDVFAAAGALPQAAAAAREAGAAQLRAGDVDTAVDTLEAAREQAGQMSDAAAAGVAANALGLAHLAADRLDEAVAAFEAAAADHPRNLRPEGHAMAHANLALAHQRAGRDAHARFAARHALALDAAPASVRAQAQAVLDDLGDPAGDVAVVLDAEDPDRWAGLLRAETARQTALGPAARHREAAAWVDAMLARRATMTGRLEAWLAALLELPTSTLTTAVEAVVAAAAERAEDDRAALFSAVRRAAVRFHVPQMTRLEQAFADAADEHGVTSQWH